MLPLKLWGRRRCGIGGSGVGDAFIRHAMGTNQTKPKKKRGKGGASAAAETMALTRNIGGGFVMSANHLQRLPTDCDRDPIC